jgi:lipopolysaccharide biosynthesis glycosyltransferase
MKNVVVIETDSNYIEHSKFAIGSIHQYGEWRGPIVLVSNGLTEVEIEPFSRRGIIVYPIKHVDKYWAKVYMLHKDIRGAYDRVLAIDQDIVIQHNIQPLFDQEGDFLADHNAAPIGAQFKRAGDKALYDELSKEVDLTAEAFCSGIMRYDSKAMSEGLLIKLTQMRDKYKKIAWVNNVTNGMADQPILNIMFAGKWKPFDRACFWGCRNKETILCHCTNWYAPWEKTGSQYPILWRYYQECRKHFEEM